MALILQRLGLGFFWLIMCVGSYSDFYISLYIWALGRKAVRITIIDGDVGPESIPKPVDVGLLQVDKGNGFMFNYMSTFDCMK